MIIVKRLLKSICLLTALLIAFGSCNLFYSDNDDVSTDAPSYHSLDKLRVTVKDGKVINFERFNLEDN